MIFQNISKIYSIPRYSSLWISTEESPEASAAYIILHFFKNGKVPWNICTILEIEINLNFSFLHLKFPTSKNMIERKWTNLWISWNQILDNTLGNVEFLSEKFKNFYFFLSRHRVGLIFRISIKVSAKLTRDKKKKKTSKKAAWEMWTRSNFPRIRRDRVCAGQGDGQRLVRKSAARERARDSSVSRRESAGSGPSFPRERAAVCVCFRSRF